MGMGYAPTWLGQVRPPPLLHKTTLTTGHSSTRYRNSVIYRPIISYGLRSADSWTTQINPRNRFGCCCDLNTVAGFAC